jgi:hypothetical protein
MGFLVNTPELVIFDTSSNKPDTTVKYELNDADNRPKVPQKNTKYNTCGYYAMNMVRPRIGKLYPKELGLARQVEKTYSLWRKQLSGLAERYLTLNQAASLFQQDGGLNEIKRKGLLMRAEAITRQTIQQYEKSVDQEVQAAIKVYKLILPELRKFQNNKNADFNQFLMEQRVQETIAIHEKTLRNLGEAPEVFLKKDKKNFVVLGLSNDLNSVNMVALHQGVTVTFCNKMPGMRLTSLDEQVDHPLTVQELIKSIKEFGPLYTSGIIKLAPRHCEIAKRLKQSTLFK